MLLETIAVEIAKEGVKFAGGEAVRRILALDAEMLELLRAADAKLDALREGPYHSGREFLEAAWRADNERQRMQELDNARQRFIDARGTLRGDTMMTSLAALHVALIEHVKGRPKEAIHWAAITHDEAVQATRDRIATVVRTVVSSEDREFKVWGAGMGGGMAAAVLVGATFLPALGLMVGGAAGSALLRRHNQKKLMDGRVKEIDAFMAYVEAVADLREGLGEPRVRVKRYQLVADTGLASYVRADRNQGTRLSFSAALTTIQGRSLPHPEAQDGAT
jgi:hypothetical protein